eukprot:NODE_5909_length_626_cov_29.580589_g5509_i0.p1 GENE.NODE_5909_length_626_cov_29.580589_g5509_i0~~NODE_5909_length_626_cov_29.580589_g5509_i0.p1  ORF type:complete len:172 (+),score=18.18 NODE_5909_length_626_cov_29.580589_g5509_i0:60-518(+)
MPLRDSQQNLHRFLSGEVNILVSTDVMGRGLDILRVDTVIMHDFPLNAIDFVHRTGRTGRMGARGRCVSLVTKRDLGLATPIAAALKRGESLEEVTWQPPSVRRSRPALQNFLRGVRRRASSQRRPEARSATSSTPNLHRRPGRPYRGKARR